MRLGYTPTVAVASTSPNAPALLSWAHGTEGPSGAYAQASHQTVRILFLAIVIRILIIFLLLSLIIILLLYSILLLTSYNRRAF